VGRLPGVRCSHREVFDDDALPLARRKEGKARLGNGASIGNHVFDQDSYHCARPNE
jgi:predicted component of type VI protein secretion system